jgi:hypothetical protein
MEFLPSIAHGFLHAQDCHLHGVDTRLMQGIVQLLFESTKNRSFRSITSRLARLTKME